jgi:hypothetical protein
MPAGMVGAMPPAQVLLLYLSHFYHELRDELFKVSYLPFPQARPLLAAVEKKMKALPDTEATVLARGLLPIHFAVPMAQVRFERKIAAVRAIEALRLHALKGGKLPGKFEQVTIAPVPNDPGTGKPFEYECDGQTAILSSRIPGEPLEMTGLRYRLTLRK